MNKIYKIIWDSCHQTWAVVSELVSAHGKSINKTATVVALALGASAAMAADSDPSTLPSCVYAQDTGSRCKANEFQGFGFYANNGETRYHLNDWETLSYLTINGSALTLSAPLSVGGVFTPAGTGSGGGLALGYLGLVTDERDIHGNLIFLGNVTINMPNGGSPMAQPEALVSLGMSEHNLFDVAGHLSLSMKYYQDGFVPKPVNTARTVALFQRNGRLHVGKDTTIETANDYRNGHSMVFSGGQAQFDGDVSITHNIKGGFTAKDKEVDQEDARSAAILFGHHNGASAVRKPRDGYPALDLDGVKYEQFHSAVTIDGKLNIDVQDGHYGVRMGASRNALNSQLNVLGGANIVMNTHQPGSAAISMDNGQVNIGGDTRIVNKNNDSFGLYLDGVGASTAALPEVNVVKGVTQIDMAGSGAHAVRIANGAKVNVMGKGVFHTEGEEAHGVVMVGDRADKQALYTGHAQVLASGVNAHALSLAGNVAFKADQGGSLVSTQSDAVVIDTAGAEVEFSFGPGKIAAQGHQFTIANDHVANVTLKGTEMTATTGKLFNISGDGVTNVVAEQGARLKGNVAMADQGALNVSLLSNADWTIVGDTQISAMTNAGGSVTFDQAATFHDLTVTGDYQGGDQDNPGRVVVNTTWHNDANSPGNVNGVSKSNTLTILGTATGHTLVSTPNGIIGDISIKDKNVNQLLSVPVIAVADAAHTGRFRGAAATTNAGEAQLFKQKDGSYVWTLTVKEDEGPDGVHPGKPDGRGVAIYGQEVSGYVQMARANMELGYVTLASLHERVGERALPGGNGGDKAAEGQGWSRLFGKSLKQEGKQRLRQDTDVTGFQLGHDVDVRGTANGGHRQSGVYATYARGKTEFFDRYKAIDGKLSADDKTGKGTTESVALGLYATQYSVGGRYLDLVGQVSYLRNKFEAGTGLKQSQNGYGAMLSAEVGQPYPLAASSWQLEPQAQLIYQYVHLDDFNDGIRTVDPEGSHGVRARVGARLTYGADNAVINRNAFYALANVWHDFTDTDEVDVGRDRLKETYNRTWGELGLGVQLPIAKNSYTYVDVRYEKGFGNTNREGYKGNIGLKYVW